MLPEFSLIALQSQFFFDIFKEVLAGAIWAVLAWLIWKLFRVIQHLFKVSRAYYRINGAWIGPCCLPRYSGEREVEVEGIEIYHLSKNKENLTLSFFHYRPDTSEVTRYEGAGVYRGERVSAFYYIDDSKVSESGVFVLRKVGELFKGFYAQYPRSSVKPYQSAEVFILRRIQISLWAQLKMLLHRPPYKSYAEVEKLYKAAQREQPDPEVRSQVVVSS